MSAVTQTFLPGPRLIDGSDLDTMVQQINAGFVAAGVTSFGSNTAITTVGDGTLTAAAVVGGVITRSGPTAAYTDTTDTAAAIVAAVGTGVVTGQSWYLTIKNTVNFAATLVGGSGVTLAGNSVIAPFTWARFLVKLTSLTAVAITFIEGGQLIPLPPVKLSTEDLSGASLQTITAAGLAGAQLSALTISTCNTGGVSLPTPAQMFAAVPNAVAGFSYQGQIRNTGQNTVQLAGLLSTHLSGLSTTILSGITESFIVTLNTATDMTLTGLGKSGS